MKVLLFEHAFRVSGHRLPYAALVAEALHDHELTVAIPRTLSEQAQLQDFFDAESVTFYDAPAAPTPLRYASDSCRWLARLIRTLRPDHVVVPTADGMATLVGAVPRLLRPSLSATPISVATMIGRRPADELSWRASRANSLKWNLLKRGPWRHVALMDPRAYAEVRDEHFATAGRVLLAPEPVPSSEFNSKQQARQALGIEVPGRLIVSPGNQDVRKGSDVLLQAFCQAELRADDQLLIMGRCSKAVAELLAGLEGRPRRGQIIVRDQFVSDSEFCAAVMAADLVATPYRNTLRPSGVISRCIAWGVPCWGPPQGWPGWAIRRFRAGFALDLSSPGTIADSLGRALSESTRFQRSVQAAKFADFNTAENYQRLWRHLVDPIDSQPLPRPEFLEYA